jgi:hypothetical protein
MEPRRQSTDSGVCDTEDVTRQSLSGEWEGHYLQHDEQHRIRAELTQTGNRLSGTMVDVVTEFDHSLDELACEAGMAPGMDESIDAQLRRMFPNACGDEVRIQSVLPSNSRLEGTVAGDYVVFTKTYDGEHRVRYLLGDQGLECVTPSHTVRYDGRIIGEGRAIEGHWVIYGSDPQDVRGRGTFVLNRVDRAAQ